MRTRTMTEKHVHVAVDALERGPYCFSHCFASYLMFIEVCQCGAERRRLSNGRFGEIGSWSAPQKHTA